MDHEVKGAIKIASFLIKKSTCRGDTDFQIRAIFYWEYSKGKTSTI